MSRKNMIALVIVALIVIGGLAHKNHALGQRLDDITTEMENLNDDNEDLRKMINEFEENKNELQRQLEELEAVNDQFQNHINQLEKENYEFQNHIDALEEENYELKKLYANMQKNSSNMLALSEEDKKLLAQLIYSEARGESKKGQQAVANVVLNRIQDPRFPDTVRETIHQPRQFVEAAILHTYPVMDSAIEAIEMALEEDVTKGAFFFWAPTIATCRWLESRTITTAIGGHQFLR